MLSLKKSDVPRLSYRVIVFMNAVGRMSATKMYVQNHVTFLKHTTKVMVAIVGNGSTLERTKSHTRNIFETSKAFSLAGSRIPYVDSNNK
jgi:hypothetical protein